MKHPSGPGPRARRTGARAEDAAAEALARDGWQLLARNLRLGPLEIDIVARQGDVVAIVEVRCRGTGAWVSALDSVDHRKRDHLRAAARRLWDEQLSHDPSIRVLRFDVAVVSFDARGDAKVERIVSAFQ